MSDQLRVQTLMAGLNGILDPNQGEMIKVFLLNSQGCGYFLIWKLDVQSLGEWRFWHLSLLVLKPP